MGLDRISAERPAEVVCGVCGLIEPVAETSRDSAAESLWPVDWTRERVERDTYRWRCSDACRALVGGAEYQLLAARYADPSIPNPTKSGKKAARRRRRRAALRAQAVTT